MSVENIFVNNNSEKQLEENVFNLLLRYANQTLDRRAIDIRQQQEYMDMSDNESDDDMSSEEGDYETDTDSGIGDSEETTTKT